MEAVQQQMMEAAHGQGRHYLPEPEMKGYRVDFAQAASEWGMMPRGMMEAAHGQGRHYLPERGMMEAGEGRDRDGESWGIGCWQQTESSASISARQTTHSLGDEINWPGKTLPCRR